MRKKMDWVVPTLIVSGFALLIVLLMVREDEAVKNSKYVVDKDKYEQMSVSEKINFKKEVRKKEREHKNNSLSSYDKLESEVVEVVQKKTGNSKAKIVGKTDNYNYLVNSGGELYEVYLGEVSVEGVRKLDGVIYVKEEK